MTFTHNCFVLLLVAALASLALADEKKGQELFNGKSLDGWKLKGENTQRSQWTVGNAVMDEKNNSKLTVTTAEDGKGELVNAAGGGIDIYSVAEFGDCHLSLEMMVPGGVPQNSGVKEIAAEPQIGTPAFNLRRKLFACLLENQKPRQALVGRILQRLEYSPETISNILRPVVEYVA